MIQTKQNGRRKLARISESEILRKQDDAVLQNTKRATKFGLKVFKGKRRGHTFANQRLTSFFHRQPKLASLQTAVENLNAL